MEELFTDQTAGFNSDPLTAHGNLRYLINATAASWGGTTVGVEIKTVAGNWRRFHSFTTNDAYVIPVANGQELRFVVVGGTGSVTLEYTRIAHV